MASCILFVFCGHTEASKGGGPFTESDSLAYAAPIYLRVIEELEVANIDDDTSCVVHIGAILEATSKNEQGFMLVRIAQLGRADAQKKDVTVCPMGKLFIVPPDRYQE